MSRDQIREFTTAIVKESRTEITKNLDERSDVKVKQSTGEIPLLIDLDGFFRPMTEAGEVGYEDVLLALPRTDEQARLALTLHLLFRSSFVLTIEDARADGRDTVRILSEIASLFATVGAAQNLRPQFPGWLTFYSDDLHRYFVDTQDAARGSRMELTLDQRLVAFTDGEHGKVRVSAITREYLLRINVYLANLAQHVVERGQSIGREDSRPFYDYALHYVMRLHRDLHPSHIPVARPVNSDAFAFAQRVTQIQMEFLISHEFGHLVLPFGHGVSRGQQEWECDSFAYQRVSELNKSPQMWFLAVRWLFELLAFDRVLGECLNFTTGDWLNDVDWLQEKLRSRRRLDEIFSIYNKDGYSILSSYESIGSMLLLDLKGNLCDLGTKRLQETTANMMLSFPVPNYAQVSGRVAEIAGRYLKSSPPISMAKVFETWTKR